MKADRLSLIAAPALAAVTVVAVLLVLRLPSPGAQLVAAALLLVTTTAVVIVAIHGTAALATVLLHASVVLLPLNGIRRGGMTASDALLVLVVGVGLLHPGFLHLRLVIPRRFWVGIGIFVVAGAIGSFGAHGEGIGHFARLLSTMLVAVVGIALWRPDIGRVRTLAYAWLGGNTVNVLVAVATVPGLQGRRPSGLATHPNALGLVCALSVAFAVFIYATGDARGRSVAVLAAAVALVGVAVSGSRAAVIASIVALLVRTLLTVRWRTAVTGSVLAGVVWGVLSRYSSRLPENSAFNRLLHPSTSVELSNAQRLDRLHDSFLAFQAHPWIGGGFAKAGSAHDVVLQVAVSSGLVGLIGFALACSPMGSPVWTKDAGPWRWVALPAVTYFVAALTSNNLWDRYVWFSLGLGMLAYTRTHGTVETDRAADVAPQRFTTATAVRQPVR